jgi:EAL domain-containing protein (putative c-di-GMP-specific phosphodiesterase class I)
MRVTVEGIETPEQLAVVRAAGCDTVQGYLVSRPKPTPEVDAVLAGLGAPWALGRGATPAAVAA